MNKSNRIEAVANLAIIALAIMLAVVLLSRYFVSSPPAAASSQPSPVIKPGTELSYAKVDWKKNEKSLVMVLSTTCKYCSDSAQFYKRLTEKTSTEPSLGTVAVFPQKVGESAIYLKEKEIKVGQILEAEPSEFSVRGTPSLLLVNKDGVVLDSWVGKLTPEKEQEVLTRIFADVVTKNE